MTTMTTYDEIIRKNVEKFGLKNTKRFNSCQLGVILCFYSHLQTFDCFESHLNYDTDFKNSLAKVMRSYTDRAPFGQNKSRGTSRNFVRRIDDGTLWSSAAYEIFLKNKHIVKFDFTDYLLDEHIINCGFMFDEMCAMQKVSQNVDINKIADLFDKYFKVVIITKEEANILGGDKNKLYPLNGKQYKGLGLKQVPKNWDKQDVFYRAWQIPGFAFATIQKNEMIEF